MELIFTAFMDSFHNIQHLIIAPSIEFEKEIFSDKPFSVIVVGIPSNAKNNI